MILRLLSAVLAAVLLVLAPLPLYAAPDPRLDAQAPCFMRADAFLTSHDLGAFTQFVDVTHHSSPFHHLAGTNPPLVRAFRIRRIKGFITDLALHGEYRKENDALARSLGYKVGKWPLVPLQGTVVRDHPGVLEVYETHYLWRSLNGARAQMSSVRGSLALASNVGDLVKRFPVHLGDDAVGDTVEPATNDGRQERSIDITVRFGERMLGLQLRGGAAMSPATALAPMTTATAHMTHACATAE